jgi:hypothetical protein
MARGKSAGRQSTEEALKRNEFPEKAAFLRAAFKNFPGESYTLEDVVPEGVRIETLGLRPISCYYCQDNQDDKSGKGVV